MHFQILWHSITGDNRFLITPSITFLRKFFPPEPLETSTTAFLCIFSSLLNSKMEEWNYRSRQLLKAIFLSPPKKTKKGRYFSENCMDVFCTNHLHEMSQPSSHNQQSGKWTYCRFSPQSFRINCKDTLSHISLNC